MGATIDFLDADASVDVGPYGYARAMIVYRNDLATEENLKAGGATRAYAEFALARPHHLVGFSSDPDGMGAWQVLLLEPEVASRYEVGAEVTFHFRKSKELGFGDLVAITSDPAVSPKP